jgi:hypothetical protein
MIIFFCETQKILDLLFKVFKDGFFLFIEYKCQLITDRYVEISLGAMCI